jgi:hypothetical protein
MISANELRIGNHLKSDVVVKIDARSIFDIWDNSKKYEPIPITKDWILNFGFKYSFEKTVYSIRYKFNKSYKVFKIEYCGNGLYLVNNIVYIKYVHQLQNIYFALTQNELECQ